MSASVVDFRAGVLRDPVLLRYASWFQLQRAPRGKSLKMQAYLLTFGTHNAEVEGSSPSLTTKINMLRVSCCNAISRKCCVSASAEKISAAL